jgi:hypothetical protein
MSIDRVIKTEWEHRVNFIRRGWNGNGARVVELATQLRIDARAVQSIIYSPLSPSEKATQLSTLVKPQKTKAAHRNDPLSQHTMIQKIYSYIPCRERHQLALIDSLFNRNHLPSYIADLRELTVCSYPRVKLYAKALRCQCSDVLELQRDAMHTFQSKRRRFKEIGEDRLIASLIQQAPLERLLTLDLKEEWLDDEQMVAIAARCAHLASLRFHGSFLGMKGSITDKSGIAIGTHCHHLIELDAYSTAFTDRSVEQIGIGCPLLKKLRLGTRSDVTEGSLIELAARCSELESFDIFGPHVTEDGMIAVLETCPQLSSLHLYGMTGVTDRLISVLIQRQVTLTELSLPYDARNISFFSLSQLLTRSSDLRQLALPPAFSTARTIDALGKSCPSLRQLTMSSMQEPVQLILWERLFRGCPQLEVLDLGSVSSLNDASLEMIAAQGRSLRNFKLSITDSYLPSLNTFRRLYASLPARAVELSLWHRSSLEPTVDSWSLQRDRLSCLHFNLYYVPKGRDAVWAHAYKYALRNLDNSVEALEEIMHPFRLMIAQLPQDDRQRFFGRLSHVAQEIGTQQKELPLENGYLFRCVHPSPKIGQVPAVILLDILYRLGIPLPSTAPF